MNELKVFQNSEFGELGVLTIDGKEYFPATQCATILGYKSPKDAIYAHCKGAIKHRLPTSGGTQEAKFIPEGDLYHLIIRSKLPAAEKFERWVFDEVLPELRKNGSYGNDNNLEEIIAKTATAVVSEVVKQIIPAFESDTIREYTENPSIRRISRSVSVSYGTSNVRLKSSTVLDKIIFLYSVSNFLGI